MPSRSVHYPISRFAHHQIPVPCPWHLLQGQDTAWCWRDGLNGSIWFAVGQAQTFATLDACRQTLATLPTSTELEPRAFAVIAFDERQPMAGPWQGFAARSIVLPQLLVRWHAETGAAALSMEPMSRSQLQEILHSNGTVDFRYEMSETSHFSLAEWKNAVRKVQKEIADGKLEKAVLSRQVQLSVNLPFDPAAVAERLAEEGDDSILFAQSRPDAGVFLGVTPETLFRLRGSQLTVDSLAGTRPRGSSDSEDRALEFSLLQSAKDRHEQELVTQYIMQRLAPVSERLEVTPEPRVRKLATVQHLYATVQAQLSGAVTLDNIVSALHPTPATCGLPVERARALIASLEPEPRGLYAGLFGRIGANDADFAVAIRSGLIQGKSARVFGGAGIVAESDAAAEYDECAWKMEPLRRAL